MVCDQLFRLNLFRQYRFVQHRCGYCIYKACGYSYVARPQCFHMQCYALAMHTYIGNMPARCYDLFAQFEGCRKAYCFYCSV